MEYVFQTQNITKKYWKKIVLNDVNINVKKGEIYGLIGKNGAGKTTLMKILVGIIKPTYGKIIINESENLDTERKKIGSLIENPSFYPTYSAKKNIELFATMFGVKNPETDKLLDFVNLKDVGKKPVKKFSLGMKQRLGIAISLIGNPEILVLDEPINGLDPEGIKLIRDLLIKINKDYNTTIFISSHLLDELSKIASSYCIIDNGNVIEEITKDELESNCGQYLKIVCDKPDNAKDLLEKNFAGINIKINDKSLCIYSYTDFDGQINKLLINNGIYVKDFTHVNIGLEQYFIDKINDYNNKK